MCHIDCFKNYIFFLSLVWSQWTSSFGIYTLSPSASIGYPSFVVFTDTLILWIIHPNLIASPLTSLEISPPLYMTFLEHWHFPPWLFFQNSVHLSPSKNLPEWNVPSLTCCLISCSSTFLQNGCTYVFHTSFPLPFLKAFLSLQLRMQTLQEIAWHF